MCSVGIFLGEASLRYSFPNHPMNSGRVESFWQKLKEELGNKENVKIIEPIATSEDFLLLFHTKEYIDFVKRASEYGFGYLDHGDTPAYKGIFEASTYAVGSTLLGLDMIMKKELDHVFNPVGGHHHARRDRAAGFCVFNDAAIAIIHAKKIYGLKRILYVDIDAHHGDGVCYGFYDDPMIFIADIHEDGRYLYPGTGFSHETGSGKAEGTKLNIPLEPGAGDKEFKEAFIKVEEFAHQIKPELIIFQCGADGLENDPLTHLRYTEEAHRYSTKRLHEISHELCNGRIIALGGGGYNLNNVAKAWLEVVKGLLD
ncbi:MAG: acetoin utilization protein AcuC [archaeon]|nr:acetoin utilization protein AcuC [archaeon]MCP8314648.1 acetoin utilization protein AcuC [archaeon]MCP8317718.1 acetoin utilization protein AcuC [archaeon]MCP8319776.1 acetoin utilization protein AcuC [archaeon]